MILDLISYIPSSFLRESIASVRYRNDLLFRFKKKFIPHFYLDGGYYTKLKSWRNIHINKRCFILGNGPSLNQLDLSLLKNDYVLGSNKIFKNNNVPRIDYLVSCDDETLIMMGKEFNAFRGSEKLVGLQHSKSIHNHRDVTFFNFMNHLGTEEMRNDNREFIPQLLPAFSNNFAEGIFNLGNATHILIQLAYFLGFERIYLVGVDHNYGMLPKLFQPGHIEVTKKNYHLVQECHFSKDYYKIGDKIGVPDVAFETAGYETINNAIGTRTKIFNAGLSSRLEVFEKVDFKNLF